MENRKTVGIIGRIIVSVLLIVISLGSLLYSSSVQYTANEDKGRLQRQLTEKLVQITGVWATVKIVSGVISVVQTIQVQGSIPVIGGLAVSAQPLGWANVIDNTLDKVSTILLWAIGAIAIEKLLLTISWWLSLKIVIPVCTIFIIVALWNKKYKERLKRIIAGIIIIGVSVCSAVPLSLEFSNAVETAILSRQITNTIHELEGQSGDIEKEGAGINDTSFLDQLRRLGTGIANLFGDLKQKFDSFIEYTINYIMCFMVTNLLIPVATIFGLKYLVGVMLRFIGFSAKEDMVIRYLPEKGNKVPMNDGST